MSLPSISQQVNHNDTKGEKKKQVIAQQHNMLEKDSGDDLSLF